MSWECRAGLCEKHAVSAMGTRPMIKCTPSIITYVIIFRKFQLLSVIILLVMSFSRKYKQYNWIIIFSYMLHKRGTILNDICSSWDALVIDFSLGKLTGKLHAPSHWWRKEKWNGILWEKPKIIHELIHVYKQVLKYWWLSFGMLQHVILWILSSVS